MNEKDCLLLLYLQKEQNITKAAEHLFMTQPALTYRIRQLEKEFQVEILSKNGKNIRLTPAGEHLVEYAKRILSDLRKTKEFLLNLENELIGSLKIGVNSHFGLYNLPSILKDYIKMFPKVELNVDTGFSTEMMDLLVDGQIDVAIVRGDYNWSDGKYLLSEENVCIIANEPIDVKKLPRMPMINRKEPKVLLKYKTSPYNPFEQSVEYWWNQRFIEPPIVTMKVDSYETCKEMVKKGLGYAIIPSVFLKQTDDLYNAPLIFKNGQEMKRRTWMYYREESMSLATVAEFVRYMKKS
ncbi:MULTISPECIES: LysR family transcriptional regulator [Bacillaceae]|nr:MULTISPECIES: LysR family transcriptional regulator [Bacillaceae]MCF2649055.1 LysR family transcriptional regulator [Niallia circulans]MCM3363142.1 LysR family transcriptional regulator [Niallia sp. MER TA 168]REB76104.1 LysR family transcriptional regulator [Cutibacterium acnes]